MVSKEVGGLIEDDTHKVGSLASTYVHTLAWTRAYICVPACTQHTHALNEDYLIQNIFLSKPHCFTFFCKVHAEKHAE